MLPLTHFLPHLVSTLPVTHQLLLAANLVVHPAVARITLHGSRGLADSYRPNSDIDLSLIVDVPAWTDPYDLVPLLHAVFETTYTAWRGPIDLDLAIVFDVRGCGLPCFNERAWRDAVCTCGGVDCFGLYKVQKGFNGLVSHAGIEVRRMYPCLVIWQRA